MIKAILLAAIINAECSICSTEEMYAVGSVVLNRVESCEFPNTVKGVIKEKGQFNGYKSNSYVVTERSLEVAKDLIHGIGRNYKYLYFYLPYASNKKFIKAKRKDELAHYQYHIFSK